MIDTLFDALADEYRRQVLTDLLDRTSRRVSSPSGVSWEIAEADEVLLRRHLTSSREISEADEELLRAHHVHLPKLDDYGFVEWDRETNVVARGPRFEEVRPLLELLDGRRDELPESCFRRRERPPRPLRRPPK